MGTPRSPDYWPTTAWERASPSACGLDEALLARLRPYGDTSTPKVHGILVVRHGYIVWEHYHHGFHAGSYHSINSVTKSVVSILVGCALRAGLLPDVECPLGTFFPDDPSLQADPRKQAITLRHLLTMTSGWPRLPIEEFPQQARLVETALARPLVHTPGAVYQYDDASAHLVSAILTRVTGMSTAAFAERALFTPLGIQVRGTARALHEGQDGPHTSHPFGLWAEDPAGYPWMVDRQGLTLGGFGLHLPLRALAKLGFLYLQRGRWDTHELVPSTYVQASTQPQSAEGGTAYGYLWWIPRHDLDPVAFVARGYGGQYVDVLPGLDMVIAIASSLDDGPRDTHGQMVSRLVAAAITR